MPPTGAVMVFIAEKSDHITLLREALESVGHTVILTTAYGHALDFLAHNKADIIIADIGRTEMDNDAINAIKRDYQDIPLILITGQTTPAVTRDTVADGFITRPFRISQIETMIAAVLNNRTDAPRPSAGRTVLVVDDEEIFRTMLIRSLKLSGYNVHGASDGVAALEVLEKEDIGTVIADINMPAMDGVTLMSHVRKNWPDVAVVLITGYLSTGEQPADSEITADGFLMKPFKIRQITEVLHGLALKKKPVGPGDTGTN